MNRVILLGRCGGDPEIKTFNQGKVAKFSLATNEYYKNKTGEKVTDTTWHNLVFWGKQSDLIEKYVHKGDTVLVEGKIQIREYEKAGVKHWSTEIVCDKIEFVSKQEPKPEAKPEEKKSSAMSDISKLPGANESAENDPSYVPENTMDDLPY